MILAFSLIYLFGNIFFIPLGIFSFVTGFAFTWKWGFIRGCPLCIFFNFFFWHLGHFAAFLLGRYCFFDFISRRWRGYKSLEVLKSAVQKNGAWVHF
jgi:uncharacterized membrane protein YdjX (TVP38/TMEM64 family)